MMITNRHLILFTLTMALGAGGYLYAKSGEISAKSLKKRIDRIPLIINVLGTSTYRDCHIAGSINIPLDQLKTKAKKWNKNKHIIVYCASYSCPVSGDAYNFLKEMGFENVWRYEGGTNEWLNMGFSTEGPCRLKYLKPKETKKSVKESLKVY